MAGGHASKPVMINIETAPGKTVVAESKVSGLTLEVRCPLATFDLEALAELDIRIGDNCAGRRSRHSCLFETRTGHRLGRIRPSVDG
jgi:hypothetical protein